MRKVYIVRHGEPAFPGGVWLCIGSGVDLPLSERGREQAAALRPFIKKLHIDSLWSSPMKRAAETARLAAGDKLELHIQPDLREFFLGDWEGMTTDDLDRLYPGELVQRVLGETLTTPGGENLADAGARFEAAVRDVLARSRGTVLIAAHMGVTSAFLCRVTGTDPHQWHRFNHDYATVTELDFEDGAFRLVDFGMTGEKGA